jgi:type IV secretory pathway VirB2 component (pilin)
MPAVVNTASGATSRSAGANAQIGASSGSAPQSGGFRRLWRALKQLFHEMTGAMFAILAFAWLNNAFRAWTGDVARWLIALAMIVAGIFAFFAVSAFRRARKI